MTTPGRTKGSITSARVRPRIGSAWFRSMATEKPRAFCRTTTPSVQTTEFQNTSGKARLLRTFSYTAQPTNSGSGEMKDVSWKLSQTVPIIG